MKSPRSNPALRSQGLSAAGRSDAAQAAPLPGSSVPGQDAVADLPTLQRNALRKLLDRPHFTPAEVAELGFRRLQLTRGLGSKGLETVLAWLRCHGYELDPLPNRCSDEARRNLRIERAIQLLRAQGFTVLPGTAGRDGAGKGEGDV
ncbi:hypothetical protein [Oryzomicrobium sp.]|uniref:hypothetical protein n=1 Tax=Oryzomicrobium sp. TaxID=1911578 RepID=UPI002FE2F2CD